MNASNAYAGNTFSSESDSEKKISLTRMTLTSVNKKRSENTSAKEFSNNTAKATEKIVYSAPTQSSEYLNLSGLERTFDEYDVEEFEFTESTSEFYEYLRICEVQKRPLPGYLEFNQRNLDPTMRSTLVDWLVEVTEDYKLQTQTLMLSVAYVDRFLSKVNAQDLECSKLQLVGTAALLIASKYEEVNTPCIADFIQSGDNTYGREEVVEMERRILETLSYELRQPTTSTFLFRILEVNHKKRNKDERSLIASLSAYLAELAMLDEKVTTNYLPSAVASSCVLLANFILIVDQPVWSRALQAISGNYRPFNLQECCILIYTKLQDTLYLEEEFPAIPAKYSASEYNSISRHDQVISAVQTSKTLPTFLFADVL